MATSYKLVLANEAECGNTDANKDINDSDRPRDDDSPRDGDHPRDDDSPREGDCPRDGYHPGMVTILGF